MSEAKGERVIGCMPWHSDVLVVMSNGATWKGAPGHWQECKALPKSEREFEQRAERLEQIERFNKMCAPVLPAADTVG